MSGLSALIPAAGVGTRLGHGPKAWLELDGQPALVWLVLKLMDLTDDVLAAVSAQEMAQAQQVVKRHGLRVRLVTGGATRQASVLRLVESAQSPWVLIQDVARPFATRVLQKSVFLAAQEYGAAAACVATEVPVARLENGWITGHLPAPEVAIFQAPQAFERLPLLDVLSQAQVAGIERQTTAQLWLDAGKPIYPVQGEKTNIKLTTPEDWVMAQSLMEYLHR